MLNNYFKLALRNLLKYKLITFINIFGLSVGIACAGLSFMVVKYENAFDKFHEESDHIFWFRTLINEKLYLGSTPGALSPQLKDNFPEVTDACRIEPATTVVTSSNAVFKEEVLFVDPNFFEFFSFKLLQGDQRTALVNQRSVILSEKMAKKYFGIRNPIGASFSIFYNGKTHLLNVTGIAQNAPRNSSVQYDLLMPLSFEHSEDEVPLASNWDDFSVTNLVRLQDPEQSSAFQEKLMPFIRDQYAEGANESISYEFFIEALEDYHFEEIASSAGLLGKSDSSYINILIAMAFLILLVACLNFTNLSNALGSRRIMEVGLRQVLGARRKQLIAQFLCESVLIALLSVGLAIPIIKGILAFAQSAFDYHLQADWLSFDTWGPLVGIGLITGLMAGAYPSFLLSNLKTTETFKSNFKLGGNNWVTKVGLVFQFALSIGLLACTAIMFQQQKYLKHQNLGYDKEEVIVVSTQVEYQDGTQSEQMLNQFKQLAMQDPTIKKVSGVSYSFTRGNSGRMVEQEGENAGFVFDYRIDPAYLDLLDLELVAGRDFSTERSEDQGKTVIVNEAFVEKLVPNGDWRSYKLPESFYDFANASIVGVVKDYNFFDLKQDIQPLMLHMAPDPRFNHFLVKIQADQVAQTLAHLKEVWSSIRPEKPFEYSFLNEDIQKQYLEEARWNQVINAATLFAIVIAFLGLFGLLSLSLAERTKEIGIRKVLGASIANLIQLFSWDFIKLLFVAFIIASPLAWYFMQDWLSNFAYRITIHLGVFGLIGLILGLLMMGIISLQSMRAGLTNPVEALRNE